MASFNKIVIVGYLGRDPEIRYMPDGNAVCSFSVATTERRKDKSGDYQDSTLWFKVNVWGKQGEACNQYLSKGSQAYIEGRLSQQEYTDRDGNQRTSLEVRASDVQFLDRKPQGDGERPKDELDGAAQHARRSQQAKTSHEHEAEGFGGDDDSSIPF